MTIARSQLIDTSVACWNHSRVTEVVCASYEVDRAELRRRGSRHPARGAVAYLARSRTAATNVELAAVLGMSRAVSVPNLTRRFAAWLANEAGVREQLRGLRKSKRRQPPKLSKIHCMR